MVEIIPRLRQSAVLAPSSLACLSDVATVNLTLGCAHACVYCYARGYSQYPGDGRLVLYTNTLEKLRQELSRKRKRPHSVYFSPSCDLFQPVPEALELGYRVLEHLLGEGIGVAFLTKGVIPGEHFDLLRHHASLVKAQVGITTMDPEVTRRFEPYAATPPQRLAQMQQLVTAGVETDARMDPILPGITDGQESLERLLAEVAKCGVKRVAVSTLFLRPAIRGTLKRELGDSNHLLPLLEHFASAGRLGIHAERSTVTALPLESREAIYARVRAIAKKHGIAVAVCACKNPDISKGTCHIAGDWGAAQMPLFEETR